ncbi:laminin EGF-like protein, partial [Opisthorchis viverrini]
MSEAILTEKTMGIQSVLKLSSTNLREITTLGRPATQPWSPALIDWMTMTDVRISMMRFPASLTADYRAKRTVEPLPSSILRHLAPNRPPYISKRKPRRPYNPRAFADASYIGPYGEGNRRRFGYRHLRSSQTEYGDLEVPPLDFASPMNDTNSTFEALVPKVEQVPLSGPHLLSPTEPDVLSAAEFFALADLTIGGRCKCNGHAKECIVDASGHLRCACEHNTDGDDCERCKSGFMDRPWERATAQSAKSCTHFAPQTMALAHTPAALQCTTCNINKERIRLKKFCRKDAVLQATFKSRELHGSMARFEMHINQIWRLNLE